MPSFSPSPIFVLSLLLLLLGGVATQQSSTPFFEEDAQLSVGPVSPDNIHHPSPFDEAVQPKRQEQNQKTQGHAHPMPENIDDSPVSSWYSWLRTIFINALGLPEFDLNPLAADQPAAEDNVAGKLAMPRSTEYPPALSNTAAPNTTVESSDTPPCVNLPFANGIKPLAFGYTFMSTLGSPVEQARPGTQPTSKKPIFNLYTEDCEQVALPVSTGGLQNYRVPHWMQLEPDSTEHATATTSSSLSMGSTSTTTRSSQYEAYDSKSVLSSGETSGGGWGFSIKVPPIVIPPMTRALLGSHHESHQSTQQNYLGVQSMSQSSSAMMDSYKAYFLQMDEHSSSQKYWSASDAQIPNPQLPLKSDHLHPGFVQAIESLSASLKGLTDNSAIGSLGWQFMEMFGHSYYSSVQLGASQTFDWWYSKSVSSEARSSAGQKFNEFESGVDKSGFHKSASKSESKIGLNIDGIGLGADWNTFSSNTNFNSDSTVRSGYAKNAYSDQSQEKQAKSEGMSQLTVIGNSLEPQAMKVQLLPLWSLPLDVITSLSTDDVKRVTRSLALALHDVLQEGDIVSNQTCFHGIAKALPSGEWPHLWSTEGADCICDESYSATDTGCILTPTPVPTPAPTPVVPCSGSSENIADSECLAWQAFYDATGGGRCSRDDPCECKTVTCQDGHITELQFKSTSISGSIPESISALTALTFLDLQYTSISGSIPESISALTALTGLGLDSKGTGSISGSIPESISALTALTWLGLDDTSISGSIPQSFCSLDDIQYCYLSDQGNPTYACPLPSCTDKLSACGVTSCQ